MNKKLTKDEIKKGYGLVATRAEYKKIKNFTSSLQNEVFVTTLPEYWKDQCLRANLSIFLNYLEGWGRVGYGNIGQFVSNARGSANEVMGCLILCPDQKIKEKYFEECNEVIQLLSNLLIDLSYYEDGTREYPARQYRG